MCFSSSGAHSNTVAAFSVSSWTPQQAGLSSLVLGSVGGSDSMFPLLPVQPLPLQVSQLASSQTMAPLLVQSESILACVRQCKIGHYNYGNELGNM